MTTKSTDPATFGEALTHALEQFTDPVALGRSSPLATPYLLGQHLTTADTDAQARGRVLQRVLQAAVKDLGGTDADLYRTIIQERYFHGRTATATWQLPTIPLSKTQYFTHQKRAIARLEPLVLNQLNPTIRLEQPIVVLDDLIDREQALNRCLAALQRQETVMLTGSGGVGKTSLGSRLAERWGSDVLWFTVRPGINDNLYSFLFELAYFCHLRKASWLWQELLANNGKLPVERVPAIARHTLAHLPGVPLLCIDEADLLLGEGDDPDAAQSPLLALLAALHTLVPILAMGQRAVLDADDTEALASLSQPLSNVLLKQHHVILTASEQAQLHDYTAGNPRLLHLMIALHQSGEPLGTLLGQLSDTPSIQFLLGRMLQRLNASEIGLLMDLAVYRAPAPVDEWQHNSTVAAALNILYELHLIQQDNRGGVAILPAYRDVIVAELPAAKRSRLHEKAATIFQHRGRYTLATYHLRHGTEPERAIWYWKEFQEQEINRGQAYPALRIFRSMTELPLSVAAKEQVAIYCARLEKLVGNGTTAATDLRSILIRTPLLQVEADEVGGVIANDQGELSRAEELFRRAIGTAEQLVDLRLAHAYKGLGWRYRNEWELERAWHYGLLAQYEVANFQGEVQLGRRLYAEAIASLQEALALAETLDHADGIAKSCNNLGRIYTMIGRFDEADAAFDRAETHYRQIGKVLSLDGMVINRAFLLNLSGRCGDAVGLLEAFLAEQAERQEKLSPLMQALVYQNLAEALLGLERLDEAEVAVQRAIEEEEINVLPDALRTHGEIKLHQGFPDLAKQLICHALDLIDQNETPDPYLAGYAWRALARVYIMQGATEEAAAARGKAIACFDLLNLPHEVAQTYAIM